MLPYNMRNKWQKEGPHALSSALASHMYNFCSKKRINREKRKQKNGR
jgi:hypothetical protein